MSFASLLFKTGGVLFVGKKTSESVSLQFVRFRKPRWLPKAPSKIYIVRQPTPKDPEEMKQLQIWNNHYNTTVRAVRLFIKNEYKAERARATVAAEEVDDWDEVERKNDLWNQRVKVIREERQELERHKKEELLMRMSQRDEEARQEMISLAEERVRETKAKMETHIRPENLDAEIDKMLDTQVDYDFALAPDGKIRKETEENKSDFGEQDSDSFLELLTSKDGSKSPEKDKTLSDQGGTVS